MGKRTRPELAGRDKPKEAILERMLASLDFF
jgi:hypothetical protein